MQEEGSGGRSWYRLGWKKWLAIYVVAAAIIYAIVYFVFLRDSGGYGGSAGGGGGGGGGGGYTFVPLPLFALRYLVARYRA